MDWLTFISSIISAIAWPLSVAGIVWLLRDEIREALPSIENAKVAGGVLELTFGSVLPTTKQDLEESIEHTEKKTASAEEEASGGAAGDKGQPPGFPTTDRPSSMNKRPEHHRSHSLTDADEQLRAKTRDDFLDTARVSPKAAVVEAWLLVELEIQRAAKRSGLNLSDDPSPEEIVKRLATWNLTMPRRVIEYINNLHYLRNQAIHTTDPLTEKSAIDYIDTAQLLIRYLRQAM